MLDDPRFVKYHASLIENSNESDAVKFSVHKCTKEEMADFYPFDEYTVRRYTE